MSDELADAVRAVQKDRECRFLIFRGAGETLLCRRRHQRLPDLDRRRSLLAARQYQETAQMIDDLTRSPSPRSTACTGGGLELTLCCDFVSPPSVAAGGCGDRLDITPGWGGVTRLARFAGRRKAKEVESHRALFDARTAERYIGQSVCEPEQLDTEVGALVTVLSAEAPLPIRRTKFALTKQRPAALGRDGFEIPVRRSPQLAGRGRLRIAGTSCEVSETFDARRRQSCRTSSMQTIDIQVVCNLRPRHVGERPDRDLERHRARERQVAALFNANFVRANRQRVLRGQDGDQAPTSVSNCSGSQTRLTRSFRLGRPRIEQLPDEIPLLCFSPPGKPCESRDSAPAAA